VGNLFLVQKVLRVSDDSGILILYSPVESFTYTC